MHPSRTVRRARRSDPYGSCALLALPRLSGPRVPRGVIGGRGRMRCDPRRAYWVFCTALEPRCLAGLGALGWGRLCSTRRWRMGVVRGRPGGLLGGSGPRGARIGAQYLTGSPRRGGLSSRAVPTPRRAAGTVSAHHRPQHFAPACPSDTLAWTYSLDCLAPC